MKAACDRCDGAGRYRPQSFADKGIPGSEECRACGGTGSIEIGEDEDPVYVCACSWVGGDPDGDGDNATCPACKAIDKRRVRVLRTTHDRLSVVQDILREQTAAAIRRARGTRR